MLESEGTACWELLASVVMPDPEEQQREDSQQGLVESDDLVRQGLAAMDDPRDQGLAAMDYPGD